MHGKNNALARRNNIVPFKPSSTLGTIIAPLKSSLTPLQSKKAIRILSPTLPFGWVGYWKPRLYGRNLGLPQLVPEVRQNSTAVGRRTKTKSGKHDRLTQTKVHVRPRYSRSLSPEARKRIGEAKRAWWAEKRAKGKKKRVLSPKMLAAMRRNIALGRQVRLAKQKAA